MELYPSMPSEHTTQEVDLSDRIDHELDTANKIRVKFITDFLDLLKQHYNKYKSKKNRYAIMKNILMGIDIIGGGALVLTGIISDALTVGISAPVSTGISAAGCLMIATIPISSKITDRLCSRNRNFENLALKKLNQVKTIFSKAIDDNVITHEEFNEVVNCKTEYEDSRKLLKEKSRKEIEKLLEDVDIEEQIEKSEEFDELRRNLEELQKRVGEMKKTNSATSKKNLHSNLHSIRKSTKNQAFQV